jgi:DHA2 family multidrug resistance protein
MSNAQRYLIFGVLAFGQFMALLDIQIVAASLNEIQAGLSAGPDEISWVQTSYLMAELVMIPFSAYLAQALSTRWLFVLSAGLFTASSVLCGSAHSMTAMVIARALQGFTGGAMVPTVFAVGFTLFTGKQRAMIPAILGMVSVLAPTLGPTVGGLITEWLGWRWIFFINVIPGIAVCLMAAKVVKVDEGDLSMLGRIDWLHLVAMAVFLGGLEYVLEEGPRLDWFGDPVIQFAALCSLVGFMVFLERSFYSARPIVRLSPFRNPTFAIASIFNVVIGFGIYASTYLIPVYLGRVRGYNSLQIGETVFVVGCAQFFSTIIAARLSQRVDPRRIITVGLTLFAASLYLTSSLGSRWGYSELLYPQLLRGFSVMLCIVPTVGLALSSFAGPELRSASGLFNLMRNLGGAIGIATANTWLQDDTRIASLRLGESLSQVKDGGQALTAKLLAVLHASTADGARAALESRALIGRIFGREALTLAFDDVFRVMAWMFLAALILVPFCSAKGVTSAGPAPTDSH